MEQQSGKEIFENLVHEINSNEAALFSPPQKIQEGEKEIARIEDPFIRGVFGLFTMYRKEQEGEALQAKYEPDNELHERAHRADAKADALQELFWMLVRERYNCYCVRQIGVRKDWVLVEAKEEEFPGIPVNLKKLFGGE